VFTDRQGSLGTELRLAHYSGAIPRRIGAPAIAAHFGEVSYLICVWITSDLKLVWPENQSAKSLSTNHSLLDGGSFARSGLK